MKPWAVVLAVGLGASPALAAEIHPEADEVDRFMLDQHPELRTSMQAVHFLGCVGIGQVAGDPAWMTDLLGASYWDRRYFFMARVGGVWLSPRLYGIGKDPDQPDAGTNLAIPALEAIAGYNVIGVPQPSLGLEPLFNLNDRTFLMLGVGVAGGYTLLKDTKYGVAVDLGPALGARYKLLDWHNLNVYGRYQYGLSRAADAYEAGLHFSVGENVFELGYRGGLLATYLYRQDGQDHTLGAVTPIPYGAWFLRLAEGY